MTPNNKDDRPDGGGEPEALIGRLHDLARLEAAWERVCREETVAGVLVTGPGGIGKTRLVETFVERVGESDGDVSLVQAHHSPSPDPAQGLPSLVGEVLDREVPPEERYDYLVDRAGVEPSLAAAVLEIARPLIGRTEGAPRVELASSAERFATMHRWLDRQAEQGPTLVVLHEVQWGRESLDWVAAYLEERKGGGRPVFFVMTAAQEELAERPVESVQWSQLDQREEVSTIELGPLSDQDIRKVVRAMAPLTEGLLERVVTQSEGNPIYAVELVREWMERELLMERDGRLALPEGAEVDVPDSLYDICREGIERRLERFEERREDARRSLELAAVLGTPVRHAEWRRACELRGVAMPDLLTRTLVVTGVAREVERGEGLQFAHPMIRATLVRQADEAQRLVEHHRVCAVVAEEAEYLAAGERVQRVAHHRMAAGDLEEAVEPLYQALRAKMRGGDLQAVERQLEEFEKVLDALEIGEENPRRQRAYMYRGWLAQFRHRTDVADRWVKRLLEVVEPERDVKLASEVYRLRSAVELSRGRTKASLRWAERCLEYGRQSDRPADAARCYDRRGRARRAMGELGGAREDFLRALELFEPSGEPSWIGGAHHTVAIVERLLENFESATNHLRRATRIFERAGLRSQLIRCFNTRGEIARHLERWDEAIQGYLRSLRLSKEVGKTWLPAQRLNLGYALIGDGRFEEARGYLEQVKAEAQERGTSRWMLYADVGLLACAAGAGDFEGARAVLAEVIEGVESSGLHDHDFGVLFEQAGDLAAAGQQRRMAEVCLLLSASQWQAMGRNAGVARVSEKLEALRDNEGATEVSADSETP